MLILKFRPWQIIIWILITSLLSGCGIIDSNNLGQATMVTQTANSLMEENTRSSIPADSPTIDTKITPVQPTILPPTSTSTRPPLTPSTTPTNYPEPTLTSTTTPTNTPNPTLTAKEESDLLSELMSTNRGCALPCWWGVVPGQTTGQMARDDFTHLGLNRWDDSYDDEYRELWVGHKPKGKSSFQSDVNVKMYEKDNIIQFMYIYSVQNPNLDTSYFLEDWKPYAIHEILDRYGVPSRVQLQRSVPADPGPLGYDLVVSYGDLGFNIGYGVISERLSEKVDHVCFDLENIIIVDLVLYSPNQYEIVSTPTTSTFDTYSTWQEVMGTELDNFYEIFSVGNSPCIEVNLAGHE